MTFCRALWCGYADVACKQQHQPIITLIISKVKGDITLEVLTWICVPLWLQTVPLSTHLCPQKMKCVVEPGGWIAVHVCSTQESSFDDEKAHRPLFQQALQKSKQSGRGIAAVLSRPHVSHKGPPLLPPFFTSFNPNLNETQTKRSCQWSARRGGLSREMKTCRRLQPNRLPVSKRRWQGATRLSWRPFNEH